MSYEDLEYHYRVCACRSTTPILGNRSQKTGHPKDRTKYQHDRDKILYSLSFRRLRLKSQIFPEHTGDHFRTRLDHTLEVAQIGRHIARRLQLNEDLVDAIALGHDIGHAPFAHSGERALHKFLMNLNKKNEEKKASDVFLKEVTKKNNKNTTNRFLESLAKEHETEMLIAPEIVHGGFKHNWQGLRIIEKLEKCYPEHDGMLLTNAVKIGMLLHTGEKYSKKSGFSDDDCYCDMRIESEKIGYPQIKFFEAQIVHFADEIGQRMQDFEDAILSKSLRLEKILKDRKKWKFLGICLSRIESKYKNQDKMKKWAKLVDLDLTDNRNHSLLMSRLRSEIIFQLTQDVLKKARPALERWEKSVLYENKKSGKTSKEYGIKKYNDFVGECYEKIKEFPEIFELSTLKDCCEEFEGKLRDDVVNSERVNRMDGKADFIIRHVLEVYLSKPKQVPDEVLDRFAKDISIKMTLQDLRTMEDKRLRKLIEKNNREYVRSLVDYVGGMSDRYLLREYDQLYSAYPRSEM